MIVRGAGAIGATAAYGLAQARAAFRERYWRNFHSMSKLLPDTQSRATDAVDPVNAMNQFARRCGPGKPLQKNKPWQSRRRRIAMKTCSTARDWRARRETHSQ